MDNERRPRRYLKPEERRRMAELCSQSGLTQREFAKRHQVSLSSLQRWLSEQRTERRDMPAVVFREMSVPPPLTSSPSSAWAVEIVGPDGTIIRCRDAWSFESLVLLLQGRAC
jgi:transposase-like protein